MNHLIPVAPAGRCFGRLAPVGRAEPSLPRSARRGSRRAFTLIEMLVVMLVLLILVAIVIGLAGRVTKGGKFSATKNAIQAFDGVATEYSSFKSGQIPGWVKTKMTQLNTFPPNGLDDPNEDQLSPDEYIFPLVDGRFEARVIPPAPGNSTPRFDRELDPAQPAAALLMLAASEAPEVSRALQRLDARFIQKRDVIAYGWLVSPQTGLPTGQIMPRRLRIAVPVDAFGFPLRFVHPEFHGGHGRYYFPGAAGAWVADGADAAHPVRGNLMLAPFWESLPPPATSPPRPTAAPFTRSFRPFNPDAVAGNVVGDADEGTCVASRAYFYSAGQDGDPGTRTDNVYTLEPRFPDATNRVN